MQMMFLLIIQFLMKTGEFLTRLILVFASFLLSAHGTLQASQFIGIGTNELEVLESLSLGGHYKVFDAEVDADQLPFGFNKSRNEIAIHKNGQKESSCFGAAQCCGTHFVLIAIEVLLVPRGTAKEDVFERTNDVQSISSNAHEGVGRKSTGSPSVVLALEFWETHAVLEEGIVGDIQIDGRLLQDLGMRFLYPREFAFEFDDLLAHLTKGNGFFVGVVFLDAVGQKIVIHEPACSEEANDIVRLLFGGIDAYFYGLEHKVCP